jgi:predicted MPP superfamily phosphohydrolase
LERKTLDLSAKLGNFAIKRQATWGMSAPFAHCGLHEGDEITVFVTSGVGTSIFPLRIGTQSQWDLISLLIMD